MGILFRLRSFKEAFSGLVYAFTRHPNFQIHLFLSVLVLFFAWFFQITKFELVILLFTIMLGLIVEFLNTSIEYVCDLVTVEWRKNIKIAKDVAAAMMLVTSFFSVVIAILLFYPYLRTYF